MSAETIKFFAKETRLGKKLDSLNRHLISRLLETGKDYEEIRSSRTKGLSPKNPIDTLHRNGNLTKEEAHAGKRYQKDFAISNKSHHSRPTYEIRSTTPDIDYYTDDQLKASKRVWEIRNLLLQKQTKKEGHKIIDLKYLKVLECVFEKEQSTRAWEANLKMNKLVVERKVKEICQFLDEYYEDKKPTFFDEVKKVVDTYPR